MTRRHKASAADRRELLQYAADLWNGASTLLFPELATRMRANAARIYRVLGEPVPVEPAIGAPPATEVLAQGAEVQTA